LPPGDRQAAPVTCVSCRFSLPPLAPPPGDRSSHLAPVSPALHLSSDLRRHAPADS